MLEKDVIVTPSLTSGKKLDGVGPVDNRSSTNKKGGPKQMCKTIIYYILYHNTLDYKHSSHSNRLVENLSLKTNIVYENPMYPHV